MTKEVLASYQFNRELMSSPDEVLVATARQARDRAEFLRKQAAEHQEEARRCSDEAQLLENAATRMSATAFQLRTSEIQSALKK